MTAIDWNQFPKPWSRHDSDHALWSAADVWCGLQQALQGHPARRVAASPYSVHQPAERAQEVALADN